MQVDVRRAADRFTTRTEWLESRHSFSFGDHYDPDNVGHGLLLVNNDDIVGGGAGFETHMHEDMEIVTWVLAGSLSHHDSAGHAGTLHPGLVQRMSAGTGVQHSEKNASTEAPVHFVQMWVAPDEPGLEPGYEQREVDLAGGELVAIASGRPGQDTGVRINNEHVVLHAARLDRGDVVRLPEAPYLHLFVARGSVGLEDAGALDEGDAVRLTASGGQRLTGGNGSGAEVLVWEMYASVRDR